MDKKQTPESVQERMGVPVNHEQGQRQPMTEQNKAQSLPMGPRRGGPRGGMPAEKPKNIKSTIGKLFRYIGRSRFQLIALVVIMLITTTLTLAGPALQGTAINTIGRIVNGEDGAFDDLVKILMILAATYIMSSLFTWLQGFISAKVSQTTVYNLNRTIERNIHHGDPHFSIFFC